MRQFCCIAVLVFVSLSSKSLMAQGAVQAVRGAAEGLNKTVQDNQKPLTTGPTDKKEQRAPGKIDPDAAREFKETSTGLKFRILRQSKGRKPQASNIVEVYYKGWLDDETIFDSSYQANKTAVFPLKDVIPGWTEGLQLIGEGGMIELVIPAKLGYQQRRMGSIPPNSQLHFVVELVSIK